MALDKNEKLALTGSNDGTVNLWNFTQGVLLSYYTLPENVVVTGFAQMRVGNFTLTDKTIKTNFDNV